MSCTFFICSKNYYLLYGIVSLIGSSRMVDMRRIVTAMDYSNLIKSLESINNIKRNKIIIIMDCHFISFEKKKEVSFFLNRFNMAEVAFILLSDKKRPLLDEFIGKRIFNFDRIVFRTCFYSELSAKKMLSHIFEIRYLLLRGGGKEDVSFSATRISEKEIFIMCWLMDGWSLHEIAAKLMITYKTVTVYKSNIVKKFNCKNFRELYLLMN